MGHVTRWKKKGKKSKQTSEEKHRNGLIKSRIKHQERKTGRIKNIQTIKKEIETQINVVEVCGK